MKISKIQGSERELTAKVELQHGDGEPIDIKFRYKPNGLTPELERETKEQRGSDSVGDVFLAMLVPVLTYVDIQDDEGVDIPITEEALSQVPLRVLDAILSRMNEAANPGKPKSGESRSFSRG